MPLKHKVDSVDTQYTNKSINIISGNAIITTEVPPDGVQIDVDPDALPAAGYIVAQWTFPGTLVTATGAQAFPLPAACTFAYCQISCTTAPTGANGITVDVNYHATTPASATTIFTTGPGTNRPVIAASGFTDASGAPDVTAYAAGGFLLCDIDTVGGTIAGSNLTVSVWMTLT